MVLGDRLRVMGSWWKLHRLPNDNLDGVVDRHKREIHLNPRLEPTAVLHEVLHAIEFSYNLSFEEQDVHAGSWPR